MAAFGRRDLGLQKDGNLLGSNGWRAVVAECGLLVRVFVVDRSRLGRCCFSR